MPDLDKQYISSNAGWEELVGYSRAVRAGPFVFVSGTTSTDGRGEISGKGEPYRQAVQVLENIREALDKAGLRMADVVRTRIYVVDIEHWREVGRAHAEAFAPVKPATSMVQVSKLIHPDMLVEIEADAIQAI